MTAADADTGAAGEDEDGGGETAAAAEAAGDEPKGNGRPDACFAGVRSSCWWVGDS